MWKMFSLSAYYRLFSIQPINSDNTTILVTERGIYANVDNCEIGTDKGVHEQQDELTAKQCQQL